MGASCFPCPQHIILCSHISQPSLPEGLGGLPASCAWDQPPKDKIKGEKASRITYTFKFQHEGACRNPPLLALGYPEVRSWWSQWVLPTQGVSSLSDSLPGSVLIPECQRKGCVCAVLGVCQLRASNCLESKCSEQLGWIALCKHAD